MVQNNLIFAKYGEAGLLTDENPLSAHLDLVGFSCAPTRHSCRRQGRINCSTAVTAQPWGLLYKKNLISKFLILFQSLVFSCSTHFQIPFYPNVYQKN